MQADHVVAHNCISLGFTATNTAHSVYFERFVGVYRAFQAACSPPRASIMSIMGPVWAPNFLLDSEKRRPNCADDACPKTPCRGGKLQKTRPKIIFIFDPHQSLQGRGSELVAAPYKHRLARRASALDHDGQAGYPPQPPNPRTLIPRPLHPKRLNPKHLNPTTKLRKAAFPAPTELTVRGRPPRGELPLGSNEEVQGFGI